MGVYVCVYTCVHEVEMYTLCEQYVCVCVCVCVCAVLCTGTTLTDQIRSCF